MATPSLWIDPNDVNLKQRVDSLPPTPGYCVFIDIAGSTAMKQHDIWRWIASIHNCFANTRLFLQEFRPIKSMGDALIYFIELPDLRSSGYTALQLFDALWKIATENDVKFPVVRIGAARCEHVYSLTFIRGHQDYYGIDIDMTARLQKLAKDREVVIDQDFYHDITANYESIGNQKQFASYRCLYGPTPQSLKGIPTEVLIYRTLATTT